MVDCYFVKADILADIGSAGVALYWPLAIKNPKNLVFWLVVDCYFIKADILADIWNFLMTGISN